MCHEPQSRSPQCCCQLPSSPLFLTDTLLMLEARTVIKDVCTLKCCQATLTTGSSLPCVPGIPYQRTQKHYCMRLLVRISLDLSRSMSVHAPRFNIHADIPWYLCCEPFVCSGGGALSECDRSGEGLVLSSISGRRRRKAGAGKPK